MFAYCNNTPVNACDPSGEDAIWLQDTNAVFGFGHTGLLLQDGNGEWYHTYWGNNGSGFLNKKNAIARYSKVNEFKFSTFSKLKTKLDKQFGIRYECFIYITGDFRKSVEYIKKIQKNYNLLWNNCVQVSIDALRKGTFKKYNNEYNRFLSLVRVIPIPNVVYNKVFAFNAAVNAYEVMRWINKKNTTPAQMVDIYA